MGGVLKKRKEPDPPQVFVDPAIEEARRRKELLAGSKRRGAGGTILTGPTGVGGEPNLGKRSLLGG